MKKLLLFLTAAFMLASCSKDADDNTAVNNDKTYKVSFEVKGFSIEATPLNTVKASLPSANYCQYVIYREDGSVLKEKTVEATQIDSGRLVIDEELPSGTYHMAVMSAHRFAIPYNIFYPVDYNTDYVEGNRYVMGHRDNNLIYYQNVTYTVTREFNDLRERPIEIVLQPMWSYLNIKIADAGTCILPEGTQQLYCLIYPFYMGFSVKTKETTMSVEIDPVTVVDDELTSTRKSVSVKRFREEGGMYMNIPVSNSKDVRIEIIAIKPSDELQKWVVLGRKTIYRGGLEAGFNITLSGSLGSIGGSGNQPFNLSAESFKDKEISFTE